MSAPNPGDILPLWQPEIPGEEIQAGRLGIRIRPGSPAAAKIAIIPGGPEWLRQALEARGEIDGTYTCTKPEKPLEFTGQVDQTLLTGRLGRTPLGLALEIVEMQQLEREYVMEKSRLNLRYRELQLVAEWDGELEGFTALVLRDQAKGVPILDSTRTSGPSCEASRSMRPMAASRRSSDGTCPATSTVTGVPFHSGTCAVGVIGRLNSLGSRSTASEIRACTTTASLSRLRLRSSILTRAPSTTRTASSEPTTTTVVTAPD